MAKIEEVRRSLEPTLGKKIVRALKRRTIKNSLIITYYKLKPRRRGTVGFLPRTPLPQTTIYKILGKLGYALAVGDSKSRLLVAWDDATFSDHASLEGRKAINYRCRDISKNLVEATMTKTFGYDLGVDPLSHVGKAIFKSNMNAFHVGGIVDCPLPDRREGFTYEKLIDSTVSNTFFEELRIPIIGDCIPLVYAQYKPIEYRFANVITTCALVEDVSQFITEEDYISIVNFAREIGMDYGELDALRDKDGKLYIVDANKTPFGPPSDLCEFKKMRAINLMADPLEALLSDFAL